LVVEEEEEVKEDVIVVTGEVTMVTAVMAVTEEVMV
jgi:hypothetical protein